MTKTFNDYAAQGDFVIRKIDRLPDDVVAIEPDHGQFVVAHSETGHHHVITAERVKAYRPKKPDIYTMFLQVDELLPGETPPEIKHLRGFDTHEALRPNSPGIYEVKRQREYTPKGFRRAAD